MATGYGFMTSGLPSKATSMGGMGLQTANTPQLQGTPQMATGSPYDPNGYAQGTPGISATTPMNPSPRTGGGDVYETYAPLNPGATGQAAGGSTAPIASGSPLPGSPIGAGVPAMPGTPPATNPLGAPGGIVAAPGMPALTNQQPSAVTPQQSYLAKLGGQLHGGMGLQSGAMPTRGGGYGGAYNGGYGGGMPGQGQVNPQMMQRIFQMLMGGGYGGQ